MKRFILTDWMNNRHFTNKSLAHLQTGWKFVVNMICRTRNRTTVPQFLPQWVKSMCDISFPLFFCRFASKRQMTCCNFGFLLKPIHTQRHYVSEARLCGHLWHLWGIIISDHFTRIFRFSMQWVTARKEQVRSTFQRTRRTLCAVLLGIALIKYPTSWY